MGVKITDPKQRRKITRGLEEMKRKRGQLITWALEIEELLEGILSRYFRRGATGEEIAFFEAGILRDLHFEKKIQIFEKVIKKEKYDPQKIKTIMTAIREVQNMRNKGGHWRHLVFLDSGKIVFRKKHELNPQDLLNIDKKRLKKVEQSKETAFQGIVKFHQWFHSK